MRASEVCGLRLVDVDREQGMLRIRGTGSKVRVLTLGHEGQRHLLAYLDGYRLTEGARFERRGANSEHLFLSETGRPLTKGGIALLFGRLRQRAGMRRKNVSASLLRESFALRYLQAGGDLGTLREVLRQKESASFTRSVERNKSMILDSTSSL